MKFEQLIHAPGLRLAVADLGWTEPTPIQKLAIPPAAEGRDVVGIAQTGTGKTGAFLLPTLQRQIGSRGLHTLVLCPTRELAQQVAEDADNLTKHEKLTSTVIVGGMKYGPQLKALKDGVDVIVATPGRLFDHIERGNVDLSAIRTLVLDEADRMLDMGFRPQIDAILKHVPRERQTLLFSATMPNGVHAMAMRIMKDPEWVSVAPRGTTASTVEQKVFSVRPEKKADLLVSLLEETHWEQVLVFTARKSGADVLAARLKRADVSVTVLHGDRDMKDRTKALRRFAEGDVRVLVATDIAQRGLDIEGISHVVNYDVPRNPEDYVHRIGRTGRAGRSGIAVTFVSAGDLVGLRDIEKLIGKPLPKESKPEFDYDVPLETSSKPVARLNRAGGRFGSRSAETLTPEELERLLSVG